MNPGKLRHRVTFLREGRVPDLGGGAAVSEGEGPTVPAAVVPLSAAEQARAMAAGGQVVTHRVEIRWRAGLEPFTAIRHRGRVLEIRTVLDPDERGRELHIRCEERR